ncbi:helix-hairpin-helix domain-containing protein [Ectopseudomonas guguanensis]|uniref:helix-hairpin-helix domain-containing protein n=1 Tax=Ectopseudomonas guguanensis TaxID=1198456 RepID=UPI002862C50D|nr:helix-hairpin-helix domain-containing protein [Pseudomonas guguanensis]MDR8015406.1 helix-hairpin-helix domain-containing protein [Pseudomonas guguanensis]
MTAAEYIGGREEATLVSVVFRSPTSPWGIFRFRREDGSTFEATGDFGQSVLYEEFILYGQRVPDIEGGDFLVSKFTSRPPRSPKAISGYLSELTGASRASTVKLVEHFGESTIDVLERSPDMIGDAGIPERDIERLITGWKELRSDRLTLAKIEVKGIPLYKLSKLERYYGNDADLNQVIKTDPYALYVFFDDMPFPKAMALANQLGVSNQSESAIRGAVIAALRREAWLGHSVIEGKQLGQLVVKLLRVHPDVVRPLLAPAVAELRRLNLIHVDERRVQLKQLYEAEQKLFAHIDKWSSLNEEDLDLDLVPSEQMGLKMLKSMQLKPASAKQLLTGLSALLSECFAIVQCQTFEDQLFVAKALSLIFEAYGADAVITTYTLEMLTEASPRLGCSIPRMTYAELIGLDDETGIPLHRGTNPIEADAIVVLGADALGVEEMNYLIEAAPLDGRLYLLGCPRDLPSLSVGQPFADLLDCGQFKAFHSRFWGIPGTAKHDAQEQIWAGAVEPDLNDFDPTQPISWLECGTDELPSMIPTLLREVAAALEVNPLADIRIVAPSTSSKAVRAIQDAIIAEFAGDSLPITFQGRQYHIGIPVVVRQPLNSTSCPAFSVYWPTEVSPTSLTLQSLTGAEAKLTQDDRIDVFDALVMTPKFVRGRRYELVILIALADQCGAINQELVSSLLNTSARSLIVAGEIRDLADGFAERQSSRTRSKLLNWVSEK